MGKTLEKGTWVRWKNNNQLNIGRVVDEPTKKPDGRLIYPIITMDGGKTAVGGDKIEKIPHMRKGGKLSAKKRREFENEIKDNADNNKLRNQNGDIAEALRIAQEEIERLKKLNAGLEEKIKTVENEREVLANQVSQFNKSEIVENIKQAVEQCLSNPENRLAHVQCLLNCMYKIAGI